MPQYKMISSCSNWVSRKFYVGLVVLIVALTLWFVAGCSDAPTGGVSGPESVAKSASFRSDGASDDSVVDGDWDGLLISEYSIDQPREKWALEISSVVGSESYSSQTLTVIDFETPDLGGSESMVLDPYVDAATGVTFTADNDGLVGLVKNRFTSSCVDPPDDNQKLASGVSGIIGRSGFPIQATFSDELASGTTVSLEIQSLAGRIALVKLFDNSDNLVGQLDEVLEPGIGTCGYPGNLRARKVLSVTSSGPVKYATIAMAAGNLVFVIDDFSFSGGAPYTLDIRPGSCPNPFNPSSRGVLPVAIVGAEGADVLDIDVATVRLEGVAPLRSGLEDVATPASGEGCECTAQGADGYQDLTLKFATQDIVAVLEEALGSEVYTLTLTGNLLDGTPFEMSDCVGTVGGRRHRQAFEAR